LRRDKEETKWLENAMNAINGIGLEGSIIRNANQLELELN
jgi:hypothetical protein